MSGSDFDTALITAAFQQAADVGWTRLSIVEAARAAGLSLNEARARFPNRIAVLRRFGILLDQAALASASSEGPVRDRLFDLLMSRFDAMKPHREGLRALSRHMICDPALALALGCATARSMRWMLQTAGVPTAGIRGRLRVRGLVAVWLWALRAFERDETEDLAPTMAALDLALSRAHSIATRLGGVRSAEPDEDQSMSDEPGEVQT